MKITNYRKSPRLRNYNYASDGYYFVTICVKNQFVRGGFKIRPYNGFGNLENNTPPYYFGKIIDERVVFNKCGEIVKRCWLDLPKYYHNCRLDQFVIMPDHLHGIIQIDNSALGADLKSARTLCAMIQGFKIFSTRKIHDFQQSSIFRWQRSFHDHVIRDEEELIRIRKYIIENPKYWHC